MTNPRILYVCSDCMSEVTENETDISCNGCPAKWDLDENYLERLEEGEE